MWSVIARYAVRLALWAAGHPDKVKSIIDEVVAVKNQVTGVVKDVKK